MELSLVVPVRNEAPNIAPLIAEIRAALDGRLDYEIVYVDDGSADATAAALGETMRGFPRLRVVRHAKSYGQSAAVRTGVQAARGLWIATLDGDGQNDPADIPRLYELARAAPAEPSLMVAGHRARRQDSFSKRFVSRIANRVRARLLHDATPDAGCGLKLFRRELFLALPAFDHMHRFLPALAMRQGARVLSVPVNHRPRQRGTSNYGVFDRLWVGIGDLAGMMWLMRRASRPELVAVTPEETAALPPRRAAAP